MKALNHEENVSERLREQLSKLIGENCRLSHQLVDRCTELSRLRLICEHVRDMTGDGDDESDDFSGLPDTVRTAMADIEMGAFENGKKSAQ